MLADLPFAWLPHGSDFLAILFLFLLVPSVVWIGALVSCLKHESSANNNKVVWLLVILFLHFFGAMAYLLIRRPERIRELGQ
jgi:putative effector of murein hydrolase LrgA (UPF0299 family)